MRFRNILVGGGVLSVFLSLINSASAGTNTASVSITVKPAIQTFTCDMAKGVTSCSVHLSSGLTQNSRITIALYFKSTCPARYPCKDYQSANSPNLSVEHTYTITGTDNFRGGQLTSRKCTDKGAYVNQLSGLNVGSTAINISRNSCLNTVTGSCTGGHSGRSCRYYTVGANGARYFVTVHY